jgi:hypothetical protein
MSFEDHLSSAMRSSTATLTPSVQDLASAGLRRGQQLRRRRRVVVGATVVVTLALGGGVTAALVRTTGDSSTRTVASGTCRAVVSDGVIPPWATAGFSDPHPAVPHVMSAKGEMVAILFGGALYSPPAKDVNNKILWVTRPSADSGPLHIDAALAGTDIRARRSLGAPGPSYVDLPRPGCWHLTLRWGKHVDTMDLEYVKP